MKKTSCKICGTVFSRKNYEINSGRAKFCSRKCKSFSQKDMKQSMETISKKIVSMTGLKRKPLSEDLKKRISDRLKGRKLSVEHKRNVVTSLTGRKLSDTARKNIGFAKLKERNPNWKGGIDKDKRGIKTAEYKAWRYDIFCRDWFACQMPGCNEPDTRIEAHHIKTYEKFPELKLVVSNGITLCKGCHRKIRFKEEKFESLFAEIVKSKKYKP